MPNIDFVGVVPVEIDHKYVITISQFSVRVTQPQVVKKGAIGVLGKAQGVPDVSGSFRLEIPKDGYEVDVVALFQKPGGVTLSYTLGRKKWAILGVNASEKAVGSGEGDGNTSANFNYVGTEEIPL